MTNFIENFISPQNSLFSQDYPISILPHDGNVDYYGPILDAQSAALYHDKILHNVTWKNDEVVIYGKRIVTARKVAWLGENSIAYTYSGTTKQAQPWSAEVVELKNKIEKIIGVTFNACLLNLYHSGEEGMSWHSDDEKELGINPMIASLSIGAERKFCFRNKVTKQNISLFLQNGSLLVMRGATQTHWQHCLPKSLKIGNSRINLTFRNIRNI